LRECLGRAFPLEPGLEETDRPDAYRAGNRRGARHERETLTASETLLAGGKVDPLKKSRLCASAAKPNLRLYEASRPECRIARLDPIPHLKAKITDSEEFRSLFQEVCEQAHGEHAAEVIVLAAGARWIWSLVEDLVPHAIQILDFRHAKHYLWEAGKLIYGEGSAFLAPWVKEREALLLDNKEEVIAHLQHFLDLSPALAPILHYFQRNGGRMRYGRIVNAATSSAPKPSRVLASNCLPRG
jgi:hypothetical protein